MFSLCSCIPPTVGRTACRPAFLSELRAPLRSPASQISSADAPSSFHLVDTITLARATSIESILALFVSQIDCEVLMHQHRKPLTMLEIGAELRSRRERRR